MRVAFLLFVLASAAVTKRQQQPHDTVVMSDTQSEPQWVRDPPGAEEESFIWTMTDPETGVAARDWVNAHAYRELQRWVTFVDVPNSVAKTAIVPINLELYPRHIWDQVLELCTRGKRQCHLDSVNGDLSDLKRSCQFCFSGEGEPQHPKDCERCLAQKADLIAKLNNPDRRMFARVSKASA
jgi:hypothetical protein